MSWLPMVAIAAGAFLLMKPGGLGGILGTGTSVAPAGYTYLGSGYYRGPDGRTYYRSPVTGQMAPATATQTATGQVIGAGQQVLTGTLAAAVPAATSFFSGLVRSIGGLFNTDQAPLVSAPLDTQTSDVLFGSPSGVGWAPAPLPEFPDLTLSWAPTEPLWDPAWGQMSLDVQPAAVGINGSDQAGWW